MYGLKPAPFKANKPLNLENGSWTPFELVISFKPQVGTAIEDLTILVRCGAV